MESYRSFTNVRHILSIKSSVPPSVCGAGELVGLEDTNKRSRDKAEEDMDGVDMSQDPTAVRFVNILMELGADKLFKE